MKTTVLQIVRAHVISPEWGGMPTPAEMGFIAWMQRTAGLSFYLGGFGCYNWRVGRTLVTLWMERRANGYGPIIGGNVMLYHGHPHTECHPGGGELARKAVMRLMNGGAS